MESKFDKLFNTIMEETNTSKKNIIKEGRFEVPYRDRHCDSACREVVKSGKYQSLMDEGWSEDEITCMLGWCGDAHYMDPDYIHSKLRIDNISVDQMRRCLEDDILTKMIENRDDIKKIQSYIVSLIA